MRRQLLSTLLAVLIAAACTSPNPKARTLLRDGFDVPSRWKLEGGVIEGGVLVLQGSSAPAIAMRLLPPLPDTGSLVVSIRAQAPAADDALHVDLWGFGRDDSRQELMLHPSEMGPQFAPAGSVWPSGSSDQGIWLRVFSASSTPIQVDDFSLVYVPSALWRKVSAREPKTDRPNAAS